MLDAITKEWWRNGGDIKMGTGRGMIEGFQGRSGAEVCLDE